MMLIFGGAGGGLLLVASGLVPARPSLAAAIATLRQPPSPRLPRRERLRVALAAPLRAVGLPRPGVRADLAITDRDPAAFLAVQAGLTVLGLVAPAAGVALLNLMGAGIGWATPLWLGALLAGGGYWVAQLSVHQDAEARRLAMRQTVAALLDVLPPALAAGAGVEQALTDTTTIATGWAAERIRAALATARATRVPVCQLLRQLGADTGVLALQHLAATLQLAAGEGTRIREALARRGEALSDQLTADAEAAAEAATERLSAPVMALTGLFLLFLLYPTLTSMFT